MNFYKKVNSDDLLYRYKGRIADAKFDKFDVFDVIDTIRNGKISLADVKNNHTKFKSNLGEIKKAHKNKSKEEKDSLYTIEMLYKARIEAMNLYDDYSSIMSEAKLKATKGTRLKNINT